MNENFLELRTTSHLQTQRTHPLEQLLKNKQKHSHGILENQEERTEIERTKFIRDFTNNSFPKQVGH